MIKFLKVAISSGGSPKRSIGTALISVNGLPT